MPQAIPFIVNVGAWVIGHATWLNVARVALTAGSIVYSARQAKKAKKALASLQEQGTTVTFSDPLATRRLVFGEVRIGGTTVFAHTAGTKNEHLHMIVALGKGAFEEITQIYFGDESLAMSGDFPDAGSPYYGYVRVNRNLATGTADATLIGFVPTVWTSAHKLTNISYIYPGLTWNQDVFPQGASFNISALVKGLKCYDTRSATTVYTQNPATITRYYLTSEMGVADAEIDDDDFEAAADICDETVLDADGNSVPRYTCNIVLDTADSPRDNLSKIARCMAGWVKKIGGKWRCRAGAHQSSSWSITEDELRGPISFQTADEVAQSCNGIRAQYISPETNWQTADVPYVIKIVTAPNITAGARCTILSVGSTDFTAIGAASNTVGVTFTASGAGTGTGTVDPYLGEDNGIRRWRDIQLYGTTNQPEARRLMRIELEKARHDLTVAVPCMMHAYKVQAGDYVDLTLSRYGWSGKLFEVLSHKRIYDQTEEGLAVGVDLVLREVSSAIYSRTAADETTADPSPNTDTQDPRDVDEPVIVDINSDDDEVILANDGTLICRIRIEWSNSDPFVIDGGGHEIEYRVDGETDWIAAPFVKGGDTVAWISPVVQGETYNIRIRAVNGAGAHSDWVDATDETVVGKGDPPNPVTSLTATAIPGGAILEWVEPADLDIAAYRIYENTTNSIPGGASFTVAAPGTTFIRTDMAGGDTLFWWVKALDTSGNLSTAAGSVNATALASQGATYMYRGLYDATKIYYDNDEVKNVVKYSGSYYKVNNPAKDGLNTWGAPTGGDWTAFSSLPELVATGLLLTDDLIVLKTITLGDGTANLGRLISNGVTGYGTGSAGFFLGFDGTTPKLYVGNTTTYLSWNGTRASVAGDFTAGTGDSLLIATSSGTTMGATANRHLSATTYASGTTILEAKQGSTVYAAFGAYDIGGSDRSGLLTVIDNVSGGHTMTLSATALTFGDTNLYRSAANTLKTDDSLVVASTLYIGADVNLYRSAANTLKTDDAFIPALGIVSPNIAIDNAGTYEFFSGVGYAATYLRNQDFEIRNSSGTAKLTVAASSGNLLSIGTITATDTMYALNGLSVTGNVGISGSLNIGADVQLVRSAANTLQTSDSMEIGGGLTVTSGILSTAAVNTAATYQVGGTNVLGSRKTGWTAATGTSTRSGFATTTVTTEVLAQHVKALMEDLTSHGAIGA